MIPPKAQILIGEENAPLLFKLKDFLEKANCHVVSTNDGRKASKELKSRKFDVAILSTQLPGMNILEGKNYFNYSTKIIVTSSENNVSTAVEAMRKGAIDFVAKPIDIARIQENIMQVLKSHRSKSKKSMLRDQEDNPDAFRRIVRNSESMQKVAKLVKQVAASNVPILLRGETGVGKDLVARAIHERSRRGHQSFVAVNCGSFTEDLFASELFGHKKGAFTGAYADNPGRFALANSGTLFLDEIGEVPLKNQVDLLRALESHEYQPLGDPKLRRADVRIIAATNL